MTHIGWQESSPSLWPLVRSSHGSVFFVSFYKDDTSSVRLRSLNGLGESLPIYRILYSVCYFIRTDNICVFTSEYGESPNKIQNGAHCSPHNNTWRGTQLFAGNPMHRKWATRALKGRSHKIFRIFFCHCWLGPG